MSYTSWTKKIKKVGKMCERNKKTIGRRKKSCIFVSRISNTKNRGKKYTPPRITKGDLLNYISESEPAVVPAKPKTKPTTKPDTKPTPFDPRKNPHPGEKEAPRAISPEQAKNTVIDTIMKLLEK